VWKISLCVDHRQSLVAAGACGQKEMSGRGEIRHLRAGVRPRRCLAGGRRSRFLRRRIENQVFIELEVQYVGGNMI